MFYFRSSGWNTTERSRYWECGGNTPTVRSSSVIKEILQQHYENEDTTDATRLQ